MTCAGARALSVLKFVGTVSLGLLTGVSYTVSAVSLPSLLSLPSSASASNAIVSLTTGLKTPLTVLTALASGPLFVSFLASPRSVRHPYLAYTSLLAGFSMAVPLVLPQPQPRKSAARKQARRSKMEASYEVLGEPQSESTSEGEADDMNGEGVRTQVEALSRAFFVRTCLAGLGFAMSVLGIWGDGVPQSLVYVS
ncbi:hypothetical protein CDD82_3750 [Ophiocordyceps australis]|uniref:Autophagy-related protein 33 n=1 Tax=Ophiocordyceps australis TaxID=1399860 RepID=A0A2C5Z7E3_9HYPO|nr:hypothetical protein CDD82_3750 [Ophiocordyceps australis]